MPKKISNERMLFYEGAIMKVVNQVTCGQRPKS